MTLVPGQFAEEQQKVLGEVALAYRPVKQAPIEPAETRPEISRRDQKTENDAVDAAMAEYRRLVPDAPAGSHDADLAGVCRGHQDDRGGDQCEPEMVLARSGCLTAFLRKDHLWLKRRKKSQNGLRWRVYGMFY
jgi:hypothetical protein